MELVDSHLDLTNSCLDSSHFSDSSQLLESRLSTQDMQQMERDNLLLKLLELYQALDNTQKENQLLRIEKAQLHTQLKNTKSKAKHFIQNNIAAAQSILVNQSQYKQKLSQSPPQTSQNCFMTPCDSVEDLEKGPTNNKVFIKSHKRGISNNCIISDHESMVDPKTYCYTLVNSPSKQESIRFDNQKPMNKQKAGNKLSFPKNKLNALVAMEREYEQAQEQAQNRTLENFESFYCHKKDDFNQTQRWNTAQIYSTKPKSVSKNNCTDHKHNNNDQKNTYSGHKIYQPFENQQQQQYIQQYDDYEEQQSERGTQKGMNRSMSSSGLSNKNYFNSRGFKIPTSIDEIWGSTKNLTGSNGNAANNNKTNKLSKVNANKVGLQRKTYLNF